MSFFKSKFNRTTRRETKRVTSGLTMVETLVAISILTIAVIGPLGIIAQALHTSYYTRDQMTAYYLAQEAIEHVRNLRDNRGLEITRLYNESNQDDTASYPWLVGVVSTSTTPGAIPLLNLKNSNASISRYSLEKNTTDGSYVFTSCQDINPDTKCPYLKVSNGIYGVSSNTIGATDSGFRREIYFQADGLADPQEIKMVVNVYWTNGSYPAKLTLEEYFTNWTSKTGS